MAKAKAKRGPGQPTLYSDELTTEILRRLRLGETLRSICRDPAMPDRSTVYEWFEVHKSFSDQYEEARRKGCDAMADELIEIAHDGTNDWMEKHHYKGDDTRAVNGEHIQRSRLRVDTLKWYLAKFAPRRFGDRVALEHQGADGKDLQPVLNITVSHQSEPAPKAGNGSHDAGD